MPSLLSIEALEADKIFAMRQLESLPTSPWGTARLMWEQRLSEINRQIDEARTSASKYASVALVFNGLPVVGQSDIRLDFSTEALSCYQKMIAASLAVLSDTQVAAKGKIKGANQSKLYIRDIVRGSMGFLLEELAPEQSDMFDTPLKSAVERTTLFLENLNTAQVQEFNLLIDEAAPRLVAAAQKFTKVLKDAGATAKIIGSQQRLSLNVEDINRLFDRFTDVEVTEEKTFIAGVLLGVLPDSHEFELQVLDQQDILSGATTDELVEKYMADQAFKERLLLKPVEALVRYTRTFRAGKLLREQVLLENLEPRSEREMPGRF